MRKTTNLLFLLMLICQIPFAQIGINSTNSAPAPSAMLDISSSNKGLLIPRVNLLSTTDNTTIANPALSLMVFNTNSSLPEGTGFYAWDGSNWDLIKAISNNPIIGKNQFFIPVDGDPREFWVHVPLGYDPATPTPVLIMLHGTSGDGQQFYLHSGWTEVGDEENIITVFPSSWKYRIDKGDGTYPVTTKWNTPPDAEWTFFPGEVPRDDIKFLKAMITALKLKLNVDAHRIYLEGFSNGGEMAAKCSIEMSDILAAVACNAGKFKKDTTYTPKRLLPLLYSVGNEDYGPGNTGLTVPIAGFGLSLTVDSPLNPAHSNYLMSHKSAQYFGLDPNHGPIFGDPAKFVYTDFVGLSGQPNNVYRHYFVNGLGHKFPNEHNFNGYDAPREHWNWMKQYTLP
jgi:polyhydroxybutyrate depolymerase